MEEEEKIIESIWVVVRKKRRKREGKEEKRNKRKREKLRLKGGKKSITH